MIERQLGLGFVQIRQGRFRHQAFSSFGILQGGLGVAVHQFVVGAFKVRFAPIWVELDGLIDVRQDTLFLGIDHDLGTCPSQIGCAEIGILDQCQLIGFNRFAGIPQGKISLANVVERIRRFGLQRGDLLHVGNHRLPIPFGQGAFEDATIIDRFRRAWRVDIERGRCIGCRQQGPERCRPDIRRRRLAGYVDKRRRGRIGRGRPGCIDEACNCLRTAHT